MQPGEGQHQRRATEGPAYRREGVVGTERAVRGKAQVCEKRNLAGRPMTGGLDAQLPKRLTFWRLQLRRGHRPVNPEATDSAPWTREGGLQAVRIETETETVKEKKKEKKKLGAGITMAILFSYQRRSDAGRACVDPHLGL